MTGLLHASRYEIKPGKKVVLDDYDPNDTSGFERKDQDEKDPRNSTRN